MSLWIIAMDVLAQAVRQRVDLLRLLILRLTLQQVLG